MSFHAGRFDLGPKFLRFLIQTGVDGPPFAVIGACLD